MKIVDDCLEIIGYNNSFEKIQKAESPKNTADISSSLPNEFTN